MLKSFPLFFFQSSQISVVHIVVLETTWVNKMAVQTFDTNMFNFFRWEILVQYEQCHVKQTLN